MGRWRWSGHTKKRGMSWPLVTTAVVTWWKGARFHGKNELLRTHGRFRWTLINLAVSDGVLCRTGIVAFRYDRPMYQSFFFFAGHNWQFPQSKHKEMTQVWWTAKKTRCSLLTLFSVLFTGLFVLVRRCIFRPRHGGVRHHSARRVVLWHSGSFFGWLGGSRPRRHPVCRLTRRCFSGGRYFLRLWSHKWNRLILVEEIHCQGVSIFPNCQVMKDTVNRVVDMGRSTGVQFEWSHYFTQCYKNTNTDKVQILTVWISNTYTWNESGKLIPFPNLLT